MYILILFLNSVIFVGINSIAGMHPNICALYQSILPQLQSSSKWHQISVQQMQKKVTKCIQPFIFFNVLQLLLLMNKYSNNNLNYLGMLFWLSNLWRYLEDLFFFSFLRNEICQQMMCTWSDELLINKVDGAQNSSSLTHPILGRLGNLPGPETGMFGMPPMWPMWCARFLSTPFPGQG